MIVLNTLQERDLEGAAFVLEAVDSMWASPGLALTSALGMLDSSVTLLIAVVDNGHIGSIPAGEDLA